MANRRKKDIKSRMRQKRAVKHRSAHVRKIRRSDLVLHRIDANSRVSNLLRTQYGRVEYGSDPDNDIINGIRIGILQIVDGRPLLRAYAYNTLYPLDSAEAKCLAYPRDHTPDQVPHRNCSCGFWSLNSVDK